MTSTPRAHRLFVAACVAGVAHAVPSLYWALGGTALVSTLGQWAEDWQRESPGEVAVLLSLIFLAKLAGAGLPIANERGLLRFPRVWRGLFWCAAALLVVYGAINVVTALASLSGIIGTAETMDTAALVGHAFLWDPLFLLWGLLLAAALKASRPHHAGVLIAKNPRERENCTRPGDSIFRPLTGAPHARSNRRGNDRKRIVYRGKPCLAGRQHRLALNTGLVIGWAVFV